MIAITTRSSIKVKPNLRRGVLQVEQMLFDDER